jgi:hypothetical protein
MQELNGHPAPGGMVSGHKDEWWKNEIAVWKVLRV